MEPIELRKNRDFGEMISDSFVFIRQNLKPLLRCYFSICGFFILAGTLSGIAYTLKMIRSFQDIATLASSPILSWEYFIQIGAMLLGGIAICLTTLCYMRLYHDYDNQPPAVADVWAMFKDYFLPYLAGFILFGVLICIGFFFCLAPGFWLWPIMTLAATMIVLRDNTISDAFTDSFKLIKDNWWATFGAFFIMGIVYYMCSFLVNLPAMAFTMSGIFFGVKPKINVPLTVLGVTIQNISMIFYSLLAVVTGICYYSLSEQKEGTGLAGRIDSFGRQNKDSGLPDEEY